MLRSWTLACLVVVACSTFVIPPGLARHPLPDLGSAVDPTNPMPVLDAVVSALFKVLHIDADATQCVKDDVGAARQLRDFGTDMSAGNYTNAVTSLGNAIGSLSSSVEACNVPALQAKLDALAAALHVAKVSYVDKVFKALIGAASLEKDLQALGVAVKRGDSSSIASAINTLLTDFSTITGGCGNNGICHWLDGLLRVVMQMENNIKACESAYSPSYLNLTAAVKSFRSNDTVLAVQQLASGLDSLGAQLSGSSCGVELVGGFISKLAPKLASAVVKDESIVVGSVNVYDEFYQAVLAVESGDIVGFGLQMGRMLQSLKASNCKSKACIAVQGLLGVLQLESADFSACSNQLDTAWTNFAYFLDHLKEGHVGTAIRNFAAGVGALGRGVTQCGVPDLGNILVTTSNQLGDAAVATEIGAVVSVLVKGADVTDQITKLSADFAANRYQAVGADLDQLVTFLTSTKCENLVCKIVEGLLNAAGIGFKDLQACEAVLGDAEDNFVLGAQQFRQKQTTKALESWSAGLNGVAHAVSDCGLDAELAFIRQEAQVLGFGNATIVDDVEKVLVHGVDVYEDLYKALGSLEHHDWRGAGQQMGTVMNELAQWTKGHACTSDVCYVVVGVLQFMGDIQGSVKQCEGDFSSAWTDFKLAATNFSDSHHSIFHWQENEDAIKAGVKNLGLAFTQIAKGVGDCHLQEFADLLSRLAVKLGITPEVTFLAELLHIVIEGVHIEEEIGAACTAFGDGNFVQFGFNLAKLTKTLL